MDVDTTAARPTIRPADKSPAIKSVKLMPRATIILVDDWVRMSKRTAVCMNLEDDHDDDDHYQQCDHDRVIRQELLPGS